jgi:kynurenine formamidase
VVRPSISDNVPALENIAEMSKLSADKFTVIALPMKIGGGGAPCRIVVMLDH